MCLIIWRRCSLFASRRMVMAPKSQKHKNENLIFKIIQFTLNSKIINYLNKMNFLFLLFIIMAPLDGYRIATDIERQRTRESLKMLVSKPSGPSTVLIQKIKLILRRNCIRRHGRFSKKFCH